MEDSPGARNHELTKEQLQRLAEVYRLLLSLSGTKETADGDEFGDLTQPAVSDVPQSIEEHDHNVHQKYKENK